VLSMIAGLERATLGGVVIDGHEVREPGPERAVVFQSPCLLPWLNGVDNVRLAVGGTMKHADAVARAHRYLEARRRAGSRGQLPSTMSLGTQQCVSLARALATEPRFLLLDEPFSQLDSLTRFELQDTLSACGKKRGRSWSW
jgi:ABC-type nitrate/sulfonate/bicarbonate transport system ATPase subunit